MRSTNNTKLAVVSYSIRPTGLNYAGGSGGASTLEAGTRTYLPSVYQVQDLGSACVPGAGGDNWKSFSIIRIQNPSANNASDVDVSSSPIVTAPRHCRF